MSGRPPRGIKDGNSVRKGGPFPSLPVVPSRPVRLEPQSRRAPWGFFVGTRNYSKTDPDDGSESRTLRPRTGAYITFSVIVLFPEITSSGTAARLTNSCQSSNSLFGVAS